MTSASNRKPSLTRRRKVLEDPEEVLNMVQRALSQLKQYWKWLLIGTVAMVAVLGAWGVHGVIKERREGRAHEALALARPQLTGAQAATQGIKALEQLLRDYPGTRAASEAGLMRASLLYQAQNYAEAAKAYESLLKGRDPVWDALITESLSYCYEGLGDLKKTVQVLKPLAETTSGPLQSEIRRRLAMLYEQIGDQKEAAGYWRQLLDQPPDPNLVPYLKEKVAATEAKETGKQ